MGIGYVSSSCLFLFYLQNGSLDSENNSEKRNEESSEIKYLFNDWFTDKVEALGEFISVF